MREPLLALSFLFIGMAFGHAQNSVADSLLQALEDHKQEDTLRAKLLINLSNAVVWNSTDSALTLASKGLQLARQVDWPKGVMAAQRQQGVCYYYASDYQKAMECFQAALLTNEQVGDEAFEVSLYSNLGNIHSDLKEYDQAIEYFNRFLNLSRKRAEQQNQIIALVNRGLVYHEMQQNSKAVKDLKEALLIADAIKHAYFKAVVLNNLGLAYEAMSEIQQAMDYYTQTLHLSDSIGNINTKASAINSLANIYLTKQIYDSAHMYALEALQLGEQLSAMDRQRDAWKTLSKTYEIRGNTDKAFEAYKNHITLRDSILSEENQSELTRKNMQFEMDMKEALAQSEIDRQTLLKNLSIIGFIFLLLVAVAGYLMYKRRRDALDAKKEADFKLGVAQTELKVLRSQMNPHFIFNSLNSISDYISRHDVSTANDYLIKFAKLMRLTLEHSEQEEISLADDLHWLDLYMQLEVVRLNHKFSYRINVSPDIDLENILVPPMILQPLVENSIWHGMAKKDGKGKIDLTISTKNEMLLCIVEDDGAGRSKKPAANRKKSFGLEITKSRLNILNNLNNVQGGVTLTDKTQGVTAEVRLPLKFMY